MVPVHGTWDWDTDLITFTRIGPDDRYWAYHPGKSGGLLLIGAFRDEEDQTVRPQKNVRSYWTQFGLWGVKRNAAGEFSVAGDIGAGTFYQKNTINDPPLPDIPTPLQWAPVAFSNAAGPKGPGLPRMTVR